MMNRPAVILDVRLDPAERTVEGSARLRFRNTSSSALHEIPLWLYPNRLRRRAADLGDVNFHWLYPRGFSTGDIAVSSARAGETPAAFVVESTGQGPDTMARVRLPAPVPPGGNVNLTVDFRTRVPERNGALGCLDGRCRLMGGFYPFAPAIGPGGFALDEPPPRVDVQVRVAAPPGMTLVVAGSTFLTDGSPVEARADGEPYATILSERRLRESTLDVAGVHVRLLHARARPPSSADRPMPYVREDRLGLVLDAVERGLRFLDRQGLPPARGELLFVEAPLRHQFVQGHGRVILISDEIYRIFPAATLRKFHTFELLRALFDTRVAQALLDSETDRDLDLAADLVSSFLLDAFALGEFRRVEYARDLLSPVDFIPAVDQLMYAPLVASSSTYFGDIDERPGPGDDLTRFSADWPRGRLLYHKLLDLLGAAGIQTVVRKMVGDRQPLRAAAAAVWGGDIGWFFAQWLGPRPVVNYRLSAVRVASRPGGAEHVVVDVERQGADVLEPVELRVTDRSGGTYDLVWRERGQTHTFEVDTRARLASVEIDPRRRLLETATGSLSASDDPRIDDRRPPRWRLLYQGFGALLNLSNLSANFFALFTAKPQYDLRNAISFYGFHSESTQAGIGGSYARLFGGQADRNRLTSALFAGLAADRLDPTFGVAAGGDPTPGWRLAGHVGVDHDDRDFIIDPWRAVGLGASVGYTLSALDDGRRFQQVGVGASALRLFELRPAQVLAVSLEAGATWIFGDAALRSQLTRAGGPAGLRGYGTDELLGRGRTVARLELRNRWVSDLSWNLAHLTIVRGLGSTLFVEGAAVTSCDGFTVGRDDVFWDAGASFRALHDAFGVHQQLFSVDVAVPLSRRDRPCLGASNQPPADRPRRPPVFVYLTFLPSF